MPDHPSDARSVELQTEIDRLAARLGTTPMPVGMRTNDGLNVFVDDSGTYHFTFYERGQLGFDHAGTLEDLLYWYAQSIVTDKASYISDRKDRFRYEYDVLSGLSPEWAKRRVRELAAKFRQWEPGVARPDDLNLLPDIRESL
ncbi:hypothetical protein MCHLDSM_01142 [Mycolicibacterium chlorophenolicum]|uniref:Immunity protein 63 domain-containing protein n=2 Tax=Mycolicibacterium chlorophenolicum TaxID=37916 RepID=A0A0J6WIV9_9MYCO|nr:hypothetical protein MCHLDSM_01142 [Mycolicibacterium chlorophenolicum]